MADPLKQFEIYPLISFGEIGGQQFGFTNAAAFMFPTSPRPAALCSLVSSGKISFRATGRQQSN